MKNTDASLDNHANPVLEGLKRMHETSPLYLAKRTSTRRKRCERPDVKSAHLTWGRKEKKRKRERGEEVAA